MWVRHNVLIAILHEVLCSLTLIIKSIHLVWVWCNDLAFIPCLSDFHSMSDVGSGVGQSTLMKQTYYNVFIIPQNGKHSRGEREKLSRYMFKKEHSWSLSLFRQASLYYLSSESNGARRGQCNHILRRYRKSKANHFLDHWWVDFEHHCPSQN